MLLLYKCMWYKMTVDPRPMLLMALLGTRLSPWPPP